MESRFILPVATATALHAFVFLGFDWTHGSAVVDEPVKTAVMDYFPVTVELEPPEPVQEQASGESSAAAPDAPPYTPDTSTPSPKIDDFVQPVQVARTSLPVNTDRIAFNYDPGDGKAGERGPGGPSVISAGLLDNPPRARSQVAPSYPMSERQAGVTGEVWVEFDVDVTGRVLNARVVRSSHRAFESATLRAVDKWRFEPGKRDGRVVPFRMAIPVHFSLEA